MRRYTTPRHIYTLPFDTKNIAKARVIYSQNETVVLCKEVTDCELDGHTLSVKLTQEETAQLDCKKNFVEIQVRVVDHAGNSFVSKPLKVAVEKCLDTEVL